MTNANSPVKGIPRLANFPFAQIEETKYTAYISKFGLEGQISYEDEITSNVPQIQRTLIKIGRAIAYAIDVEIEAQMAANFGNSYAITAGWEWDSLTLAQRDPIADILGASQTLRADNINPLSGNCYLVINGTDWTNLASNSKILNNPTWKMASQIEAGVIGEVCGLKIMVTEAISADYAYIVAAKEAMVWKEATPLSVLQIKDPGIKTTIRAFELGTTQVVAPNGLVQIQNTRK